MFANLISKLATGQPGYRGWISETIIIAEMRNAGPQLTRAANQSSESRKIS